MRAKFLETIYNIKNYNRSTRGSVRSGVWGIVGGLDYGIGARGTNEQEEQHYYLMSGFWIGHCCKNTKKRISN